MATLRTRLHGEGFPTRSPPGSRACTVVVIDKPTACPMVRPCFRPVRRPGGETSPAPVRCRSERLAERLAPQRFITFMSFAELGLSEKVQQAVTAAGYTEPTPIQAQAIPHVLARRDVLGIAQTGTGKTAAFVLPMLTKLESGRARARMPRTLILEPTRELAAQVEESFIKYGANHKLNVALIIGGVSRSEERRVGK